MTSVLPALRIVQNAYVVDDIERACHRFHQLYRTGPFLVMGIHPMQDVVYRGAPTEVITEAAFGWAGDIMIELISQHSDSPSAYREAFPKGTEGLHHVAAFAVDYAAELRAFAEQGYEVVMEMGVGDARISYIDTRSTAGHMVELYPDSDALRGIYDRVRNASGEWDGKDLMIPFSF